MLKSLNLTKNLGLLSNLWSDSERKSLPKLIAEASKMAIIQRCIPRHYLTSFVYKKDRENILDFLPNKLLDEMKAKYNDRDVVEVLENKLFFNFFYGQFGLSIPKVLMYNHKMMFAIGNRNVEINNSREFKSELINLIRDNFPASSIFIKKTSGTYGGDRIYRISSEEISSDNAMIDSLYQEVIKAGYLFQETIIQHPGMDKLNPSCINTIRFDTFIDNTGKVEIISSYLRFSNGQLHVDNTGSGGWAASINLGTGRLEKYGYRPFGKSGGQRITEHPLTKTVFEGFEIPDFEKAKELVVKAASIMPGLRLIGWDVGIGISGPVLIEGNSDYDLHGGDILYGGLGANLVFRKALEEFNYLS